MPTKNLCDYDTGYVKKFAYFPVVIYGTTVFLDYYYDRVFCRPVCKGPTNPYGFRKPVSVDYTPKLSGMGEYKLKPVVSRISKSGG